MAISVLVVLDDAVRSKVVETDFLSLQLFGVVKCANVAALNMVHDVADRLVHGFRFLRICLQNLNAGDRSQDAAVQTHVLCEVRNRVVDGLSVAQLGTLFLGAHYDHICKNGSVGLCFSHHISPEGRRCRCFVELSLHHRVYTVFLAVKLLEGFFPLWFESVVWSTAWRLLVWPLNSLIFGSTLAHELLDEPVGRSLKSCLGHH